MFLLLLPEYDFEFNFSVNNSADLLLFSKYIPYLIYVKSIGK